MYKLLMHYLNVRKKISPNEFEKDIDRELELNQINPYEKLKGKMRSYYLLNSSKDYQKIKNEDKKDEEKESPKEEMAIQNERERTSSKWRCSL